MAQPSPDISTYAESVAAMARALASGDERAFRAALSAFDTVRDAEVVTGVRKIAVELQTALQRFEIDSKLIDLGQHQIPDARRRLEHVLKLTAEAAHRTMDLVEQCLPLADGLLSEARTLGKAQALTEAQAGAQAGTQAGLKAGPRTGARLPANARPISAFFGQVEDGMLALRGRLAEVRLAQEYQDLSGQIIGSVMDLVDELERALGELARIADFADRVEDQASSVFEQVRGNERDAVSPVRGQGPTVPGLDRGDAVSEQQDVDALLSRLGI